MLEIHKIDSDQEKPLEMTLEQVIDVLEAIGISEAQTNLVIPQTMSFISHMEEVQLFSLMENNNFSWYSFLTQIPEEDIPNKQLYKAYIAAHKKYGIPSRTIKEDDSRFTIPKFDKIIETLRASIFMFMEAENSETYDICFDIKNPYPIVTKEVVVKVSKQLEEFRTNEKFRKSYDNFIKSLMAKKDFIRSPELKKAGKLIKKIYERDPNDSELFARMNNLDINEKYYLFTNIIFRKKFEDQSFVDELKLYLENELSAEDLKLLLPINFENFSKIGLLRSAGILAELITEIEKSKFYFLMKSITEKESSAIILSHSTYKKNPFNIHDFFNEHEL